MERQIDINSINKRARTLICELVNWLESSVIQSENSQIQEKSALIEFESSPIV